jgi:hypothetical protein
MLVWGDGYYKGPRDSDFIEPKHTQTAEHQLQRKKVLRELQALVCVVDDDGTEDVSDTEWFYLVSMSHSFAQGVGYVFFFPPSWIKLFLYLLVHADQFIYISLFRILIGSIFILDAVLLARH